jgi:hypothetical protein
MPDSKDFESTSYVTPPRPNVDQIPSNTYLSGAIPAFDTLDATWSAPADGYYYLFDSIYISWYCIGVIQSTVELCYDVGAPVWITMSMKMTEGGAEHVPYKLGGLYLYNPMGLRVRIFNTNESARNYAIAITFIKYPMA